MKLQEQIAQLRMKQEGFALTDGMTIQAMAFKRGNPRAGVWWVEAGEIVKLVRADRRRHTRKA